MMAELLTLMDVADVYLDDRYLDGLDGVVDRYTCMCVGSCVEYDAVHAAEGSIFLSVCSVEVRLVPEPRQVYGIYDVPFVVALVVGNLIVRVGCTELVEIVLEGLCTIDSRLSATQEIQIRSVDDQNFHNFLVLLAEKPYICAAKLRFFRDMTNNFLDKYYSYLKFERNFTENSVQAYLSDIAKLQKYADGLGKSLLELEPVEIEQFIWGLHEVGIVPKSQKRILIGVRAFYKFLRLEGVMEKDPTDCIDSPKLPEIIPTVLTVEEVNAIIAAADPSTIDGQRNRAILETLYSCGLRVSELTELRMSHIYEKEGFIQVFGKGRKERIVPISDVALQEIKNYEAFKYELDVKRGFEDYVFLNRFGRKLSRIMVFNIVKRYCQEANIQKEVSPHTFRHTFATHLLEGGANLRAIQMMLGHEQISTTEIYTKVDRQMLREEILTYHPRNKRKESVDK
mgnify:CR=1 FL=1